MQEAGTGHGGGAWPPICSMGHSHEAGSFTCNIRPCKRPSPRLWVNLTFGHHSAPAGVAQPGLGGPSCLLPLLPKRITRLNSWKGHLCLPPAQNRTGAFTWSVQPCAHYIAAQLEATFVEWYGKQCFSFLGEHRNITQECPIRSEKFCIGLKLEENFNYTHIPFNPICNFKDDPGGCRFAFNRPICG